MSQISAQAQFQQLMAENLPFEPSSDQSEAILKLGHFTALQSGRNVFVLTGYAGTGKTSLLGAYVKSLQALFIPCVLLAPTGRAAKVFSLKANKTAYTIHKKIYVPRSNTAGATFLALAPNISKNTVFIVDEASMIGDFSLSSGGEIGGRSLLDDLMEHVFQGAGCKLIFVGDEGQLPPVGSDYSPALNPNYLNDNFFQLTLYAARLLQVLRQSEDSDILMNATKFRKVATGTFPILQFGRKSDVASINGLELQDELESSYAKFGAEECIIITKSNKRANQYNQQVRSRILWFEEEICRNDMLMVVKNNYFWIDPKSKAGFIANGEILRVATLGRKEFKFGHNFIHATVEMIDYPELGEFDCILMLDVLTMEEPAMSREKLKQLFYEIEQDYLYEHNKKKRYELMMKNPYFNALQVKFAYAITCHKSQGGQWSAVFLDHGFIQEDQVDKPFYRWLYTGFTRAVNKLNLINFDPRFFDEEHE